MSAESMDFPSLALPEVPVTVAGVKYILQAATANAVVQYRNAIQRCTRLEGGRVVSLGISESEPIIVAACLCQTDERGDKRLRPDGTPVTVPLSTIMSWPDHIVGKLYEWVEANSPTINQKSKRTRDDLERELAGLQQRLAEADAQPNGEPPSEVDLAKNSPRATTDTSG